MAGAGADALFGSAQTLDGGVGVVLAAGSVVGGWAWVPGGVADAPPGPVVVLGVVV